MKKLNQILAFTAFCASTSVWAADTPNPFIPTELKEKSLQDEATGFIEGQSVEGSTKNFYSHIRGYRDSRFSVPNGNQPRDTTRTQEIWNQGTILGYNSGYTQGTVGFSTEVAAYNFIALQQDRMRVAGGGNRALVDSDGDVVSQWSKLGLANLKARYSNTTLTLGRQNMATPTISTFANRTLPSSFEGINLHSEEFNNLSFDLGTFTHVSSRSEQGRSSFTGEYANKAITTDRVNTGGIVYKPFKNVTASYYASQVEDFWFQQYFGLTHVLGNTDLGLTTAINYYNTRDEGESKLGGIDNNAYSVALTVNKGIHAFTAAWQQIDGNEYFDFVHETRSMYLSNALWSNFNGPNEKSLMLGYTIDLTGLGIPGLKLNAYKARGWGIDGTHYKGGAYNVNKLDGENHYEYGVGATYVVQAGRMKDTNFRAVYWKHRASPNEIDGNANELRFVTTIPFKFL